MILPFTHRVAFAIAASGWRGSQFLWKIATRLQMVNEGEVVRLPNGFPLRVDDKDWISKTVYEGTYERALLHFLDSLVLKDCVIDVGANIGVTLWHSLKHSTSSASFMAFEPSTQCFEALESTCKDINHSGKIYDFAIGSADESRSIYGLGNQLHSGAASLLSHSGVRGEKGKVQVRKLDSVLQEYLGNRLISLLKVDTEGYEAQVVSGAADSISTGKIEIIIMEVSPNFGSVEYLKDLSQLLDEKYGWFALREQGSIKRRACLDEISLSQALAFNQQWNLVLIRNDVFEDYQESKGRISIRVIH